MKYEKDEEYLFGERHLWQSERVSVYAKENEKTGNFEVELAIGYKDKDGYYFRLANCARQEKAAGLISSVLEIFG